MAGKGKLSDWARLRDVFQKEGVAAAVKHLAGGQDGAGEGVAQTTVAISHPVKPNWLGAFGDFSCGFFHPCENDSNNNEEVNGIVNPSAASDGIGIRRRGFDAVDFESTLRQNSDQDPPLFGRGRDLDMVTPSEVLPVAREADLTEVTGKVKGGTPNGSPSSRFFGSRDRSNDSVPDDLSVDEAPAWRPEESSALEPHLLSNAANLALQPVHQIEEDKSNNSAFDVDRSAELLVDAINTSQQSLHQKQEDMNASTASNDEVSSPGVADTVKPASHPPVLVAAQTASGTPTERHSNKPTAATDWGGSALSAALAEKAALHLSDPRLVYLDESFEPALGTMQVISCIDVAAVLTEDKPAWIRTADGDISRIETSTCEPWVWNFSASGLEVAVMCRAGLGPSGVNQDCFSISQAEGDRSIYIVCDGHGPYGHLVAFRAVQSLPKYILDNLREDLSQQQQSTDQIIASAFRSANVDLYNIALKHGLDFSGSGCSCSLAVRQGQTVHVAWLGDSRALVASVAPDEGCSQIDHFSSIHGVSDEVEQERLVSKGAELHQSSTEDCLRIGTPGCNGFPGLTVSRSLGDFSMSAHGLLAHPDLLKTNFSHVPGFVLLGSSGAWEMQGDGEAALERLMDEGLLLENGPLCALTRFGEAAQESWLGASANTFCDDVTALLLSWNLPSPSPEADATDTAAPLGPEAEVQPASPCKSELSSATASPDRTRAANYALAEDIDTTRNAVPYHTDELGRTTVVKNPLEGMQPVGRLSSGPWMPSNISSPTNRQSVSTSSPTKQSTSSPTNKQSVSTSSPSTQSTTTPQDSVTRTEPISGARCAAGVGKTIIAPNGITAPVTRQPIPAKVLSSQISSSGTQSVVAASRPVAAQVQRQSSSASAEGPAVKRLQDSAQPAASVKAHVVQAGTCSGSVQSLGTVSQTSKLHSQAVPEGPRITKRPSAPQQHAAVGVPSAQRFVGVSPDVQVTDCRQK